MGLRRRRGDDAGIGGGHGPGSGTGDRLHLYRAGLAVRVIPRTLPDHDLIAAGTGRRAARHSADRQEPRHAGHDRRGDANGTGHQERDPARRPDQPVCARRHEREGRGAEGGPDSPPAHPDDDHRHDPRHAAVGHGPRRGQRLPRADLDCDHWRPDHLDAADPGGRAGGIFTARPHRRAGQGVAQRAERAGPAGGSRRGRRAARRHGGLVPVHVQCLRPDFASPALVGWLRRGRLSSHAHLQPGTRTRVVGERGPEAGAGESRRDPGPRAGGEDQLPAADQPWLQLPALAAVPRNPHPGRRVWPQRANVPGGVQPRECDAALHQPAAVHRRPAEQRLWHQHIQPRCVEAGTGSHAPGDRISRGRDVLRRADERTRYGGRGGAGATRRAPAATRQSAV